MQCLNNSIMGTIIICPVRQWYVNMDGDMKFEWRFIFYIYVENNLRKHTHTTTHLTVCGEFNRQKTDGHDLVRRLTINHSHHPKTSYDYNAPSQIILHSWCTSNSHQPNTNFDHKLYPKYLYTKAVPPIPPFSRPTTKPYLVTDVHPSVRHTAVQVRIHNARARCDPNARMCHEGILNVTKPSGILLIPLNGRFQPFLPGH